jgi:hypothetical protein
MALFVPNGDVILALEHEIQGYSRPLVCTIGVGIDEGEPFDQAAVNGLFNSWAQAMKASFPATLTFTRATAYWKQPLGFVPFVTSIAAVVGTGSGTSLPPNTALMVEKVTGRPGRSGRGRMFVPGYSETGVEPNGNVISGNIAAINTALQVFYDFATDEGGIFDDLLLFHDEDNIDPTPTVIDDLVLNPRVSSIAKRFRRSSS